MTATVDHARKQDTIGLPYGEVLVTSDRRAIPVTCTTHGSALNFCNLLMTRESDGTIVLNPHVDNCCVLRLDETAAVAVFDTLGEWLGRPGTDVVHTQ